MSDMLASVERLYTKVASVEFAREQTPATVAGLREACNAIQEWTFDHINRTPDDRAEDVWMIAEEIKEILSEAEDMAAIERGEM